jgi:hypothetical protein
MRDQGDLLVEAQILSSLGKAYYAAGNIHSSHEALQRALSILDGLHHRDAQAVRAQLRQCGQMANETG